MSFRNLFVSRAPLALRFLAATPRLSVQRRGEEAACICERFPIAIGIARAANRSNVVQLLPPRTAHGLNMGRRPVDGAPVLVAARPGAPFCLIHKGGRRSRKFLWRRCWAVDPARSSHVASGRRCRRSLLRPTMPPAILILDHHCRRPRQPAWSAVLLAAPWALSPWLLRAAPPKGRSHQTCDRRAPQEAALCRVPTRNDQPSGPSAIAGKAAAFPPGNTNPR